MYLENALQECNSFGFCLKQRQTAAAVTLLRAHLNTLKRRLADKIV